MTLNERLLIGALFSILTGLTAWLLSTVTLNSARIAVLEQRTDTIVLDIVDLKADIREHRRKTEP